MTSTNFKGPSKKHQPFGMTILFEDRDIIVVDKMDGLLTVSSDKVKEKTAHFLLNNYVRKGNDRSKNRVFIVHRLDRDTSGILIFAKTEKAKQYLQEEWSNFEKTYIAVVQGKLSENKGIISSYLVENRAHRMYSVNDPSKGKLAKTGFEVIGQSTKYTLLKINLLTGRKHQIRVHFLEKGHPVLGDKIYGKADKAMRRLCLHASSLTISHPFTKKTMTFETTTPSYFGTLVKTKK